VSPVVTIAPAAPLPPPKSRPKARPNLKANFQGFIETAPWAFDGGKRRESLLDTDCFPPRVVRKVGWRNCMTCGKPFFSQDVVALHLCQVCR
jgi:hypothetical protein